MTHTSDPVDPMHRALSDAEASDEAAGYTVPVALVRSRVHRRRATRAGATVGVAALAVVAVVVAVPSFLSRTPAADPPARPGVVADWPAQFDRCGELADADPTGVVTLAASVGPGASGALAVRTTASAPAQVDEGWVYGTDLSVLDADGRVVGVQEGPTVPALDQLDEHYAGAAFATVPFPIDLDEERRVVSCDQYPDGQGAVDVAPGSYTLQVTQTLAYIASGKTVRTRASAVVPFDIAADGTVTPASSVGDSSVADDFFACGEPVSITIHSLPDAGNLVLAADLPGGDPHEWSATVGTSGADGASVSLPPAASYAIVDERRVIGFVVPGSGSPTDHEIGRDGTVRLDGPVFEVGCQADGVATAAGAEEGFTGTYTVWPYVVATPMSGGSPVVVVANPQTVMLGRGTS